MKEVRKIIRKTLHESQVSFTGVKIEKPSEVRKLESFLQKNLEALNVEWPEEWSDPRDYHMTVKLGIMPLGIRMRGDIGKETELKVNTLGVSDNALAFGVSGYISKNENQHITLKFKENPSDSKNIKNWIPLPFPFSLTGVIREY